MNWETLYNQHKDTLLIEEIEMKWREEAMLNYPVTRLGGGGEEKPDGVLLTESTLYIITENGSYIAY
jgi:hypothetical protein